MIVTLLTDYGLRDPFVGVCHGVIASTCPDARVIDISHGIPAFDVRDGALTLRNALPYMPVGIHVAVVDPGVGTARRAVALRTGDGRVLVGPDNGLLSLAWERCGGLRSGVELTRSGNALAAPSATFDGRDVFAPVAGRLACGAALEALGRPMETSRLETIEIPPARWEDDALVACAVLVDAFGNVALAATASDFPWPAGARLRVEAGGRSRSARAGRAFADVARGALLAYVDAFGHLSLAVRDGAAARELSVQPGDDVRISSA
jgi:hypothetical protein